LRIDMHVHTNRYSVCSKMTPQEMAHAAIRNGLDAVVITEHHYLWSIEEIHTLQEQFPALKILCGVEVTTIEGDMLVYGINDNTVFYEGMSLEELTANVHRDGGIVVIAHPCRWGDEIPETIFTAGVDGIEVMSNNVKFYMQKGIRTIKERLDCPAIATSDGHTTKALGIFALDFQVQIDNEGDLVRAIINRRFTIFRNQTRVDAINSKTSKRLGLL
jgi:predicted metal-dependent phosphoesterase TrpH